MLQTSCNRFRTNQMPKVRRRGESVCGRMSALWGESSFSAEYALHAFGAEAAYNARTPVGA